MKKRFTFIQIDLLTCDLNEIESILLGRLNAFCRIMEFIRFMEENGKAFKDFSLSNVFCNVLQEEGKEFLLLLLGLRRMSDVWTRIS